jgi:GT2 family glycosyltransferase
MRPHISVILPVKDGAAFVGPAIKSILNQTYKHFEVLVVDDGSIDTSISVISEIADRDSRVTVIPNQGCGLVDALNTGIAQAQGPLLARMDADDIAMPNRFEMQVGFLLENTDVVAVGSQVSFIDEAGQDLQKFSSLPEHPDEVSTALLKACCLRHPTVMMRKAAVINAGGYRNQVTAAEDLDLWLRLDETGRLANLPDVLLQYRIHPQQVSSSKVWIQRLSRNLAIHAAGERRAGRPDPLTTYSCYSMAGGHKCCDQRCPSSVCDIVSAFRSAEALLTGRAKAVSTDDIHVLYNYIRHQTIGDGKSNRQRVAFALWKEAMQRNAQILSLKAFTLGLSIHFGRAVQMGLRLR